MDVSGKPHEGWMATIPLIVLMLFVIGAMGGPVAFINTLTIWASDIATYVVGWVRHL